MGPTQDKVEYVCGFRFSENLDKVLLIRKENPEWQRGYLNGIGGKVDDTNNENYMDAMERECNEETCLGTYGEWSDVATLHTASEIVTVHFLVSFGNDILDFRNDEYYVVNEGYVGLYDYPDVLYEKSVLYNLKWLMPLALDDQTYPITTTIK